MTNAPIDQVREIIGRLSPLGPQQPPPEASLVDDLGYDSLGLFELVMELEREFDLPPMPAEDAMNVVTVGDVEALVAAVVNPVEASL